MKKILITGKDSYIGNKFVEYMQGDKDYQITVADTISDEWKAIDFSQFDTVFHVAGIAHIKETKENASLYYQVNRDLAIEVAQKTKDSGVKQFIFLSSMSVYGKESGEITKETLPKPKTNYGKSKLQAEQAINLFTNEEFKVATMRPPMIFGPGCKGNFPQLVRFAKRTRIFPYYKNKRSMLYIDNFCEFVKHTIDSSKGGIFFPQNPEYFCTSKIVKIITESQGRKIWMPRIFNPLIWIGTKLSPKLRKVFGDLVYDVKEIERVSFSFDNKINIENSGEANENPID